MKFSKGNQSIEVTDLAVDPGTSILTATAGGKSGIPLLSLYGTNVAVSMSDSDVVLQGTVAKLTATGATALKLHLQGHRIQGGHPPGCRHPDRLSGRLPHGVAHADRSTGRCVGG